MRRLTSAILALALLCVAPARAEPVSAPVVYITGADAGLGGLPGDTALYDLEGVRRWLVPTPFLTARQIAEARVRLNDATGVLEVALYLTHDGSRALRDYTALHAGGRIAFVLDDQVLSAPVVVNRLDTEVIGIWDRSFDPPTAERFAARIRLAIAAAGRQP